MTQHYYTADLHLCHEKVAKHRGFYSVPEHDYTVIKELSEVAHSGNQIYILGDISGGGRETTALGMLALAFMHKDADLHLIAGNHDSIHPMHRHSNRAHEKFRRVFASIDSMGTFRHDRHKVMLSHFPYTGDRGTDRYPEYRLNDVGKPIVHGHTHSTKKVSHSNNGSLQICVSLDAWDMKPVAKHQLTNIIDKETIWKKLIL